MKCRTVGMEKMEDSLQQRGNHNVSVRLVIWAHSCLDSGDKTALAHHPYLVVASQLPSTVSTSHRSHTQSRHFLQLGFCLSRAQYKCGEHATPLPSVARHTYHLGKHKSFQFHSAHLLKKSWLASRLAPGASSIPLHNPFNESWPKEYLTMLGIEA